jgi:oxygen-dependent protoporphyrinogen oxidase
MVISKSSSLTHSRSFRKRSSGALLTSPVQSPVQAIVIGGGISGLACAYYLRKFGVPVVVLEQSERPGGLISSAQGGGFLLEEGPQSFLSTDALLEMIRDVDLEGEVLRADARASRFVLLNGQLRRVPLRPPQLLTSSLLSLRTKFALFRDAVGRSVPPEPDESVAAFVRRKFTPELLERLVGPFISGIFAGDPERLSLRAAFPSVYQAEKMFGSVIRGAAKVRKAAPSSNLSGGSGQNLGPNPAADRAAKQNVKHALVSFRKGNESLVQALAHCLGDRLICGTAAQSVSCDLRDSRGGDSSAGNSPNLQRFIVHTTQAGRARTFEAPSVIVATPADVASRLVAPLSGTFSGHLATIEYAPVAVISSIYRVNQIAKSLDGFGFLVPRGEGLRVLGTVWNTSLFEGRAPKGYAVLTSFAGGANDPALVDFPARDIAALIAKELAAVLSISGEPEHCTVKLYPRALPQYNLGHIQTIASLRRLCTSFPGLCLAGNYLEGPSIGACVEQAQRVALSARDYLASSSLASIR